MRLVRIKKLERPTKKKKFLPLLIMVVSGIFVFFGVMFVRPIPEPTVELVDLRLPAAKTPSVDWPVTGQAIITAKGYDFELSNTSKTELSTASMAKIITALVVLEKSPITPGSQGKTYTINTNDIALLQQEHEQGGSAVAVSVGEQMTEYQMLEGMLLPSANNLANGLAIRTFGSLEKYKSAAEEYLKRNGLHETHIGADASGYDPATTSTTVDLARIAQLALDNPTIMQIAGTNSAKLETASTIYNRNPLLANGVVTGLKTGTNEKNSGSFMFTATISDGAGKPVQLAGVVANAGDAVVAAIEAEKLAKSVSDDFEKVQLLKPGQMVAKIKTAWGESAQAVIKRPATIVRWSGARIIGVVSIDQPVASGTERVGTLSVRTDGAKLDLPVELDKPLEKPGIWWRLTHFR